MDEQIKIFHNLHGKSRADYKQNWNNFKCTIDNLSDVQRDAFLENLKPLNHQEALFRLELLLRYTKFEKILDVLFSGYYILEKLILKHHEFPKHVLQQYAPHDLVHKILTQISCANRLKLINKLAVNVKSQLIGEQLFQETFNVYGKNVALPFLVSCSAEFVDSLEINYKYSDRQLIHLYNKDPNRVRKYFAQREVKFGSCHMFAKWLKLRDFEAYHDFLNFGEDKIGKKSFKKYLNNYKNEIINGKRFPLKHVDMVYKHLVPEEFEIYFKNLFPKKLNDFDLNVFMPSLKCIPYKIRGPLLFDTYETLYDTKFNEYSKDLLKILPLEDRLKFKINEEEDLELFGVDKSIPMIKEKINLTADIQSRADLVLKLFETCKINNDKDTLLEVLKYFCKRHKNDHNMMRDSVLVFFLQYDVEDLSDDFWNCIKQILTIGEINNDYVDSMPDYLNKSIVRRFKRGEDFSAELIKFLNYYNYCAEILFFDKYPQYQRDVLLKLPEIIKDVDKRISVSFLKSIASYNRKCPKNKMSFYKYPEYLKHCVEYFKDALYNQSRFIGNLLSFVPHDINERTVKEEFIQSFVKEPGIIMSREAFVWFANERPTLVADRVNDFFNKDQIYANDNKMFYNLSKMSYNGIADKLQSFAKDLLDEGNIDDIVRIQDTVKILSFSNYYFDYMAKFKPNENKSEDLAQKQFIDCYRNIRTPYQGFETILMYKVHPSYLQKISKHVRWTLFHTPAKYVDEFLQKLLQEPPSLYNTAIEIAYYVKSTTETFTMLQELSKTSTNVLAKKILVAKTFTHLFNTPNESNWKLLLDHIKVLDPADKSHQKTLLRVKKIPQKYLVDYLTMVWTLLEKQNSGQEFYAIKYLDPIKLSPEFSENILRHSLFNDKNQQLESTYNFVYDYIIEQKDGLDAIISATNSAVSKDIGCVEKIKKINAIYHFFETICTKLITETDRAKAVKLAKLLNGALNKIKLPCSKFELEVLFQTTIYHLNQNQIDPEEFALFVHNYHKRVESKMNRTFRNFLKNYLNIHSMLVDEFVLEMIKKLLELCESEETKLLVISLLPQKQIQGNQLNVTYKSIVDRILLNATPLVQIYFTNYLRTKLI